MAELEMVETQVIKHKLDNNLVDMQTDVNYQRKKIDEDLKEMDMLEWSSRIFVFDKVFKIVKDDISIWEL